MFPIQLCNIHYWSEVVHAWRVIRLSCFIVLISRIRLYARLLMCRNSLVGKALDWRSKYLQLDPEFRHRLFRLLSKRNDTLLEVSWCGFHGILSISRWNKYFFFSVSGLRLFQYGLAMDNALFRYVYCYICLDDWYPFVEKLDKPEQYRIIIYAFIELVVNTNRLFCIKSSPVSRHYEMRYEMLIRVTMTHCV